MALSTMISCMSRHLSEKKYRIDEEIVQAPDITSNSVSLYVLRSRPSVELIIDKHLIFCAFPSMQIKHNHKSNWPL